MVMFTCLGILIINIMHSEYQCFRDNYVSWVNTLCKIITLDINLREKVLFSTTDVHNGQFTFFQ